MCEFTLTIFLGFNHFRCSCVFILGSTLLEGWHLKLLCPGFYLEFESLNLFMFMPATISPDYKLAHFSFKLLMLSNRTSTGICSCVTSIRTTIGTSNTIMLTRKLWEILTWWNQFIQWYFFKTVKMYFIILATYFKWQPSY